MALLFFLGTQSFFRQFCNVFYGKEAFIVRKDEAKLMTSLKIFLGYITRNGATKEERDAVIKTAQLVKQYLPFYQKRR